MEVIFLSIIVAFIVDDRSVRRRIACALDDKSVANLRWQKYQFGITLTVAASFCIVLYGVLVANNRIAIDGCGVIVGCILGLITSKVTLLGKNGRK